MVLICQKCWIYLTNFFIIIIKHCIRVNGIKIILIKQRTLVDATHDWEAKDRSSVSNQCRESQEAKGINKDRPKIYSELLVITTSEVLAVV